MDSTTDQTITSTEATTTDKKEEEEMEEEEEEMEEENYDDDDDDEYEYEVEDDDDDDNAAYNSLIDNPEAAAAAAMKDQEEEKTTTTTSTSGGGSSQYSKQAIAMSHRVTTETTSGKRRLAADLHKLMCSQDALEADGFTFHPTNEDSMEKWTIHLSKFDPDSALANDMLVVGLTSVELEMNFPNDYPFAPPFVRVIRPRFQRRTGFVVSGALCMELLTKDGWRPTNDIESVIVSIRSLMVEGGGRLAAIERLSAQQYNQLLKEATATANNGQENNNNNNSENNQKPTFALGSYSEAEAKDGYQRATYQHQHGYSDDITKKG